MKGLSGVTTVILTAAVLGCADTREEELDLDRTVVEEPAPAAEEWPAESDGPALDVASLGGVGSYLTDAEGRALYLLEEEPADSSICYEECAQEWPPFLAQQGSPRAANAEVGNELISTIERRDGQRQVTYAGHPLYYYHDDRGPGDTAGQDVTDQWGEWYLVRPDGQPLEEGAHAEEGEEH